MKTKVSMYFLICAALAKVSGGGTILEMSHAIFRHTYEEIISLENLLLAWKEFSCGKRKRIDVLEYELDLMTNLFDLHESLRSMTYSHDSYHAFRISDPKPRDIHKASIHQNVLMRILSDSISDVTIVWLLGKILGSFDFGLPLGNLASQIFANIYMNEFDQFAKHRLCAKNYIRYADDFVFLHEDKQMLEVWLPVISDFLNLRLRVQLHPLKVEIRTLASGVDFLGWVHFPDHRVLRAVTARRMFKNVDSEASRASYFGMLSHGNGRTLQNKLATLDPR